jgi:RNA polymerase sigma-70 factor (ECF subfamily)
MAEGSDGELMERLARGERDALASLIERHQRRIYRICLSYLRDADEALDAVQETFVRAFENAASWSPAAEVGAWLARIAVNHSIDRYRRRKRRLAWFEPLADGDRDDRVTAEDPSPERKVLSRELSERIDAALRSLPPQQRAVFVLRHYHDMSLEEVAGTLGLRLGTVKSNLHRAIHRLRGRLAGVRA